MAQRTRRLSLPFLRSGLGRDSRGATLIEFGLFMPILGLMALGTMDLGRGLAARWALEQAAQRTIELANLGRRRLANYDFLKAEAASAAGVPVGQVTLNSWVECRNTSTGATRTIAVIATDCAATEKPARYVTIAIWKNFTPMFASIPIIGRIGTNGVVRLSADSGVRVQ